MAYISNEYCFECCKETRFMNGKCVDCQHKEKKRAHAEHFAKLDMMSLEERVRRIEKILYEQSKNPPWKEPTY